MTFTPFTPEENTWMRRDTLAALIQTITFAPCLGLTGNNAKAYGPTRTYHARVTVADEAAIYTASGEVVVSKEEVIFYPLATDDTSLNALGDYPLDARLTLPDGTSPRILSIAPSYDGLGIWLWTIRT